MVFIRIFAKTRLCGPKSNSMVSDEALKILSQRFKLSAPVHVRRPRMPELSAYSRCLEQTWLSRWLTHSGQLYRDFERRLNESLCKRHDRPFGCCQRITVPGTAAVGALSMVNRNCQEFGVYAGIPARKVKERTREVLKLRKEYLPDI